MDSPGGQSKIIVTEEQFRNFYPDVSIQPSKQATLDLGKRLASKNSPSKAAVVMTKTPIATKSPATTKASMNLRPTSGKANSPMAKNPAPVTPKTPAVTKTVVAMKTPVASKVPLGCNSPAAPMVRSQVVGVTKSPVCKSAIVKSQVATGKIPAPLAASPVVKTPQAAVRATPVKLLPSTPKLVATAPTALLKTPQSAIKPQQTTNSVKAQPKPAVTVSNKDSPDQSTVKILNFNVPVHHSNPQRSSNQITIENVQAASIDPANRILLQQFIKNSQSTPENKEGSTETTLQSIVIGTTTQSASNVVAPIVPVQITMAEPIQAVQVSQQVTLFGPKGHTLTVDDLKKQINNSSSTTMTNVVSSTTNPTPVPPPPPKAVPMEAKKVQAIARVPIGVSPVRHSPRTDQIQKARQYQSTKGQVRKVSPKRDIVPQKVQPLLPPPPPPPELQTFENEEEVTTSEEMPAQENDKFVKVVVMLPEGCRQTIHIHGKVPNDYRVRDLLNKVRSDDLEKEIVHVRFPTSKSTELPEPGEILGLEPGEMIESDLAEDGLQSEFAGASEDIEDLKDAESKPIYQEGLLAVCQSCGYTSIDFNNCQRCKRKLPPDCKTIPADLEMKTRKTKADSLTAGDSPRKKRVKRRVDEPVPCLTILSDDEDHLGLRHLSDDNFHSDTSQMSSCDKEPIITNDMIIEMKQSISGGGVGGEDILDKLSESEKTYLQCRTVRIGSYKTVPKDKVLITPYGIKLTVNVLNSPAESVELKILHHEIIKVLIHFGRQMPVLFFYTRPAAAAKIRKALKMEDRTDFYYDTMSTDETHKRITFLPDKIEEDCKQKLKTIFNNEPEKNLFAELSGKEANDILVKASPKEVQEFIRKKQPQKLQPEKPLPQQQPPLHLQQLQQSFNGQNIQTIMVYPPPPEKGGIPINTEDYACLDEDQFLNDVIIDFYLKYVVEKTLNPEDRARTHVFSSFFYKRLTTKPPSKRKSMNPIENDPAATPAQKRHSRVKSWTKNVDLFSKDYVVIPINENSHWFLAIICYPGLTGPVRKDDDTPIEVPGRKKKKLNDDKGVLSGKQTVTIGSTTITAVAQPPVMDLPDDGEDRDEADGEDEDMDVPDEDEELKEMPEVKEEPEEEPIPIKKQPRVPIKQPCILIFDSLAGASRSRVVATLRDYLRVEYEVKHGEGRDFSGEVMKGSNVRCPQQTNYTDCGLYVLQYVEAFFQWPILDYHIPIKQLVDWFQADIVSRKRYEIQQLLHRLMQEQDLDIEAINLPVLSLKPGGYCHDNEMEEDDEEEHHMCEDEDDEHMMGDSEDYHDPEDHGVFDHDDGEVEEEDYDMDDEMEHEDEMDDDGFPMNAEGDLEEDELEDEDEKELDDISSLHGGTGKRKMDLKHYRIPRLRKDNINDDL